jgi:hypothetical protein
MMPLALIGVLLISLIVGWGVYYLVTNITFKRTTERYKYVSTKDQDGNEIVKVVDLQDKNE